MLDMILMLNKFVYTLTQDILNSKVDKVFQCIDLPQSQKGIIKKIY